jgi:hypothetical protein
MKIIDTISVAELQKLAENMYGDLVKGVIDLKQRILVLDAEMHADEEVYLLENGSLQSDLWGINLYPDKFGADDFIEFDAMINIRPRQGNMTRSIEDESIRFEIIDLISQKVIK